MFLNNSYLLTDSTGSAAAASESMNYSMISSSTDISFIHHNTMPSCQSVIYDAQNYSHRSHACDGLIRSDVMMPNTFYQMPMHAQNIIKYKPDLQTIPNRPKNEIKSEIIKSEDHATAVTSTAPVSVVASISQGNVIVSAPIYASNSLGSQQPPLVTARPKIIKCLKCNLCPFISISQTALDSHSLAAHQTHNNNVVQKKKLSCPGCDNIFYSKKSLKTHLVNDHQMSLVEIKVLLESFCFDKDEVAKNTVSFQSTDSQVFLSNQNENIFPKNEIIKPSESTKIDCLYKALNNLVPSQSQFNEIDFINLVEEDEVGSDKNQPNNTDDTFQNKIFVKNVNILQKPNYLSSATDYNWSAMSSQPIFINNNETFQNNQSSNEHSYRKPGKIFIKNVDILKKPLPLNYNDPINSRQCFYSDESKTISHRNNLLDEFPFSSSSSPASPSPHSISSISLASNNRIIDILTPPGLKPSTENSSSDQLRSPNKPMEIRKSTLHLRTVDELNLMNINVVQNLVENYNEEEEESTIQTSINLQNLDNLEHDADYDNIHDYLPSPNYNNYDNCRSPENDQNLEDVIQDFVVSYQNDQIDLLPEMDHHLQRFTQNHHVQQQQYIDLSDNCQQLQKENFVEEPYVTLHEDHVNIFDNIDSTTSSLIEEKSTSNTPNDHKMINTISQNHTSDDVIVDCDQDASTQMRAYNDGNIEETAMPSTTQQFYYENAATINEDILFVCSEDLVNCNSYDENDAPQSDYKLEVISSKPELESSAQQQTKGRIYVVNNLMKDDQTADKSGEYDKGKSTHTETLDTSKEKHSRKYANISSTKTTQKEVSYPAVVNVAPPELNVKTDESLPLSTEPDQILVIDLADDNVDNGKSKSRKPIGRPRGYRRVLADNAKSTTDTSEIYYKCTLDCSVRFKSAEILQIHERCHDPVQKTKIICPECKETDFSNWNTLHTHLWRQHKVDMELYSCDKCVFKTPILSRLMNTHIKIHSDERNFKCSECDKAFKNTKQLKNHRRIHSQTTAIIRKCEHCDVLFYNSRHLRNHIKSIHDKRDEYKCDICGLFFASKKSKQTHQLNHNKDNLNKQFKCDDCAYSTNDYCAYRRHRMTHNDDILYSCPYCPFKSIQSIAYQKHILQKHPEHAKEIVFECDSCKFTTINERKYDLHMLNHEYSGKNAKANSATIAKTTVATSICEDGIPSGSVDAENVRMSRAL